MITDLLNVYSASHQYWSTHAMAGGDPSLAAAQANLEDLTRTVFKWGPDNEIIGLSGTMTMDQAKATMEVIDFSKKMKYIGEQASTYGDDPIFQLAASVDVKQLIYAVQATPMIANMRSTVLEPTQQTRVDALITSIEEAWPDKLIQEATRTHQIDPRFGATFTKLLSGSNGRRTATQQDPAANLIESGRNQIITAAASAQQLQKGIEYEAFMRARLAALPIAYAANFQAGEFDSIEEMQNKLVGLLKNQQTRVHEIKMAREKMYGNSIAREQAAEMETLITEKSHRYFTAMNMATRVKRDEEVVKDWLIQKTGNNALRVYDDMTALNSAVMGYTGIDRVHKNFMSQDYGRSNSATIFSTANKMTHDSIEAVIPHDTRKGFIHPFLTESETQVKSLEAILSVGENWVLGSDLWATAAPHLAQNVRGI